MSASDHLSPGQFHMPIAQFANATSSIYHVPLHEVMPHMQARYDAWRNEPGPEPHPEEIRHGGPQAYVDHLRDSIATDGLKRPPLVSPRKDGHLLDDGHHRGLALLALGVSHVKVQGPR